jgi:branched-chain amino acid aminotransferase
VVRTFEFELGELRRVLVHATLAETSARLPAGAYTSLRTYGRSRVLRLRQHAARLAESLALQGWPPNQVEEPEVRRALAGALRACAYPESRVRITASARRLYVSVEPFAPLPASLYEAGVACVTLPLTRQNPHAKDTRFIATAAEAYNALPPGVHEGLLTTEAGEILEGLSSNFFGVASAELRTEGERVLEGVTRSLVLELAGERMGVVFSAVRVAEIPSLEEAFVTSASRGVLPVVRIDESRVGAGAPGPVTRELIGRLADLVEREAEDVLADVPASS